MAATTVDDPEAQDIIQRALRLPPEVRKDIAIELFESARPPEDPEEVKAAWRAELGAAGGRHREWQGKNDSACRVDGLPPATPIGDFEPVRLSVPNSSCTRSLGSPAGTRISRRNSAASSSTHSKRHSLRSKLIPTGLASPTTAGSGMKTESSISNGSSSGSSSTSWATRYVSLPLSTRPENRESGICRQTTTKATGRDNETTII